MRYGEENPRASHYYPGGQSCQPSQLSSVRDARQRARKAESCEKEAEEYRLSTNDLVQQTRAANAASAQADIASQQLWTGWLQTLGGFLTLAAAVGAAIYARDAASHTRDANEITLGLQRAWVVLRTKPELVRRDNHGLYFRLRVVAENVGQTAATHFGVRTTLLFRQEQESDDAFNARTKEQVRQWMANNQHPAISSLPPGDTDQGSYWDSKFPPELTSRFILPTINVTSPVLLFATFYRTMDQPETLQVSWRTWLIASKEENGEEVSFLYMYKTSQADTLHAIPLMGMRHEEYPANDGNRNRS